MSSLSFIEKEVLESLFNMESGYVLDFSDRTFDTFFMDEASIDIRSDYYSQNGTSKAKRLRFFWETQGDKAVGKVLYALIKYVEFKFDSKTTRQIENAKSITNRLLNISVQNVQETEEDFLKKDFGEINIDGIPIEPIFVGVMKERLIEISKCMNSKISLSSIILSGSVLEGILLGIAQKQPALFNKSKCAPISTKTGKPKQFHEWSLSNLIDVSTEIGILTPDIKKFSHGLRDFRNYIHPYEQASSQFKPDEHTANICHQVLKAAIHRIKCYYSERGTIS